MFINLLSSYERIIETKCPTGHGQPSLVCKMAAEFRTYYVTKGRPKWWCHVDDDNYVNRDVIMRVLSRYDADNDDVYIGRASWVKPIPLRLVYKFLCDVIIVQVVVNFSFIISFKKF